MMHSARVYRLKRLLKPEWGRCVMVPMDHGVTLGPLPGLGDVSDAVRLVSDGGADCVVVHKGQAKWAQAALAPRTSLVVHLSASLAGRHVLDKVQVCTVAEALRLGADAVSVHVNVGSPSEREQIAQLARVAAECEEWSVPLLCMTYVREGGDDVKDATRIAHAVRVAAELGADIAKCHYTGDAESFRRIVDAAPIPVLIAGGPRVDSDAALLGMISDAVAAGARGVSIGRNVFAHPRPALLTRQIARIVHQRASVAACLEELRAAEDEAVPPSSRRLTAAAIGAHGAPASDDHPPRAHARGDRT